MKRITLFLRPHRLELVKAAVAALDINGMSVAEVRGTGNSEEFSPWANAGVVPLPIRSRLMVVVPDDQVDTVIEAMLKSARTGEPNDGKLFVENVIEALRIRTGERGERVV